MYLLAMQLDNAEQARIAAENRLRQATRDVADKDGHLRGLGLTKDNPVIDVNVQVVDALAKVEAVVLKALTKQVKYHPLGPWQKKAFGVGEKQLARLLACIGDPYWHAAENRPRKVSELTAYCGYSVVNGVRPRRKRGEKSNWSPDGKMRAHLIAESCIKHSASPYRAIYDQRRESTVGRNHITDCVRCGPAGKPALSGSEWSKGHSHADALSVVAKQVLKDLWVESRRLHKAASQ